MYAKVNGDFLVKYPYSYNDLILEYPNVSLEDTITRRIMFEYNIAEVEPSFPERDYRFDYVESDPVKVNGKWIQSWDAIPASQDVIDSRIAHEWEKIRKERNLRLLETDWTQVSDAPLSSEQRTAWASYRQELRDLTTQENPFDIVFPQVPNA